MQSDTLKTESFYFPFQIKIKLPKFNLDAILNKQEFPNGNLRRVTPPLSTTIK